MNDEYLKGIIPAMRDQERIAFEEKKEFFEWSEADIAKALDPNNAEVRRLTEGATPNSEVERLAGVLADILKP